MVIFNPAAHGFHFSNNDITWPVLIFPPTPTATTARGAATTSCRCSTDSAAPGQAAGVVPTVTHSLPWAEARAASSTSWAR